MATRSETRAHGGGERWRSMPVEQACEGAGGLAEPVGVERRDRRLEPVRQPRARVVCVLDEEVRSLGIRLLEDVAGLTGVSDRLRDGRNGVVR